MAEMLSTLRKINRIGRNAPASRFTKALIGMIVLDAVFVLILTFGAVFPSRIATAQPGTAMPDDYYDYSAKVSPVRIERVSKPKGKKPVPVISARRAPAGVTTLAMNASNFR